jgi:hypothetical protein
VRAAAPQRNLDPMRIPILRGLASLLATTVAFSAVSCGGGGSTPQMVLISFNLPNVAGVQLNAPLIWTFSDDVDPLSCTPDSIQIVGFKTGTTPPLPVGYTFEKIVVDGNLVAEIPFTPNFEDYTDSGLVVDSTYNVFLPVFPTVNTIRSLTGKPLAAADPFSFKTLPTATFLEPRRPLVHAPGPFGVPPGKGDEDGCLQNPNNELYTYPGLQFGTDPDARLLCLVNEGPPRVIPSLCSPLNDQRNVGTPSAVAPGTLDLGAIKIALNEAADPVTVVPWIPTTQLSLNVQLWRVGDTNANPVTPTQIKTNKPIVTQSLALGTTLILAPAGPQLQGTYLINIQGVRDLAGNLIMTSDSPPLGGPAPDGYASIAPGLVGKVPPGHRTWFRTFQIPPQNGAYSEEFSNNFFEQLNNVFTRSNGNNPREAIPGAPSASDGFTLRVSEPGQATTANWNGVYKFLGLTPVNDAIDDGLDRLKAVYRPYFGRGHEGSIDAVGSQNIDANVGDGVFEYDHISIANGANVSVSGTRPALFLVRHACTINGKLSSNGGNGGSGLDSDGSSKYDLVAHPAGATIGGSGGLGGAGGGAGGHGSPRIGGGDALPGGPALNVFGEVLGAGGGAGASTPDNGNTGGGGGGFGTVGTAGSPGGGAGGGTFGQADFGRALTSFIPDRVFQPQANLSGGSGGGGGGAEDDSGASETANGSGGQLDGDDGGGGGGGGGGGLWIIADTITVGSTGVVECNGGNGGKSYAMADQTIADPNGIPSDGDEFVIGVNAGALAGNGTGAGAGGGGGSGGGILLQGRSAVTLAAGSNLHALGGTGGVNANGRSGGNGGKGRIAVMAFLPIAGDPGSSFTNNSVAIDPPLGVSGQIWKPTVESVSQGVSTWIDFSTPSVTFQPPFYDTNFSDLTGAGLTNSGAGDFTGVVEFEGAATLDDPINPTVATGLTGWVSEATYNGGVGFNNAARYLRWRWRFRIDSANTDGGTAFDQDVHAMPSVLDFTVPFKK